MDVNQGNDKHPMRFVVDKATTVQGHVAAGSTASVDYQPDPSGQLVALSVKEQSRNRSRNARHYCGQRAKSGHQMECPSLISPASSRELLNAAPPKGYHFVEK